MSRFFVKGIPTKRRPRFTKSGHTYTDPKTKAEEEAIAKKYNGPKYRGCVSVEVDIYPRMPKGTPKKLNSLPAMKKPDVDNVLKVVMDALQGKAYDDDKQVTRTRTHRHPMQRLEFEYIVVTVKPIERER